VDRYNSYQDSNDYDSHSNYDNNNHRENDYGRDDSYDDSYGRDQYHNDNYQDDYQKDNGYNNNGQQDNGYNDNNQQDNGYNKQDQNNNQQDNGYNKQDQNNGTQRPSAQNGDECTHGEYSCSDTASRRCNWGKWVDSPCPNGTYCVWNDWECVNMSDLKTHFPQGYYGKDQKPVKDLIDADTKQDQSSDTKQDQSSPSSDTTQEESASKVPAQQFQSDATTVSPLWYVVLVAAAVLY
jgi:hypothetical protein